MSFLIYIRWSRGWTPQKWPEMRKDGNGKSMAVGLPTSKLKPEERDLLLDPLMRIYPPPAVVP